MSLPAAFTAALAQPGLRPLLWLEIEGLPYAFGNRAQASSFFSGRTAAERREGILAYMTAVPAGVEQEASPWEATSSVGALEVSIIDPDDGAALALVAGSGRLDYLLHITADIATGDAPSSITVSETTPDAAAYPTNGGRLFIGRETFLYTSRAGSVFSGITRYAHRIPGQTDLLAHVAGAEVTPYPRFLVTRRATFMVALDDLDANRVERWSGTIVDAQALDGLVGFKLQMESMESELKRTFFGGQRRAKLAVGTTSSDGEYSGDDGEPVPSTTTLELDPATISGAPFVENSRYYVRVDDEYFRARYNATGLARPALAFTVTASARRCYGSPGEAHSIGAEVVEILHIGGQDSNGSPEIAGSRFTAGAHPLELLLQALISGSGDGSAYDVLPEGYGMGVPSSRVDVAGIEALRDQWLAGVRHFERLEAPVEFKAWVATLLRPYRCYPVQRTDGKFTVRRLNPPIPGLTTRAITAASVLALPTWEANVREVYGRVIFKCDYDPTNKNTESEPWRQTYRIELLTAQERYAGRFKEMVIEAPGQWSGTGAAWTDTAAGETAQRLADGVRQRLGSPWPLLGLDCDYAYLDVEIGDLVTVTLANVPNVLTGARGLSGVIFEVVRRTVDDENARVVLTLAQTGYSLNNRLLAPSGRVFTWNGTDQITLWAHAFTGSAGPADASFFVVNDKIAVYSPDLGTSRGGVGTITNIAGNVLTVTGSFGTPVTDDIVTLPTWSSATAARRDLSAFLSDATLFPGYSYAS